MNTQVNVRMPKKLFDTATTYSKKHGYGNVQDFIKEALREKLFEKVYITKKEMALLQKLVAVTEEHNLFGTEEELKKALGKR